MVCSALSVWAMISTTSSRLLIFVISLIASSALGHSEKTITIFYDTGEASATFFNTQLCNKLHLPQLQSLVNSVNLELVPYGNTSHQFNRESKRYTFKCSDTDPECAKLKIHACLLQTTGGTNVNITTLDMVCKLFQEGKDEKLDENTCADNFLANSGSRTASIAPPVSTFPAVMKNNDYNEEYSSKMISNFIADGSNSGVQVFLSHVQVLVSTITMFFVMRMRFY